MKSALSLFGSLVLISAAVTPAEAARSGTVICGAVHGPRAGNTELVDASIGLRNANADDAVRITRFTVRNFFGTVVRDFGENGTGGSLPPNTDFPMPVDVTTVPPGANYYLATTHIFGTRFVNDNNPVGGGNNMSVVIEFETSGDPERFIVSGSLRVVELIGGVGGLRGAEHTRSTLNCRVLK